MYNVFVYGMCRYSFLTTAVDTTNEAVTLGVKLLTNPFEKRGITDIRTNIE